MNRDFLKKFFELICTAIFAYLLLDSILVLEMGGEASRIDLLGFLVPHASKIALWSAFALLWLRPKIGWRFPFAMFMLYCAAEMTTNLIYVGVHVRTLSQVWIYNIPFDTFILAETFFALGIGMGYIALRREFSLKADWSMIPFIVFIGSWVAMGYQTESTIANPSYWLEAQEFIWNVLWIVMVSQVFRSKVNLSKEPKATFTLKR